MPILPGHSSSFSSELIRRNKKAKIGQPVPDAKHAAATASDTARHATANAAFLFIMICKLRLRSHRPLSNRACLPTINGLIREPSNPVHARFVVVRKQSIVTLYAAHVRASTRRQSPAPGIEIYQQSRLLRFHHIRVSVGSEVLAEVASLSVTLSGAEDTAASVVVIAVAVRLVMMILSWRIRCSSSMYQNCVPVPCGTGTE